MESRCRVGILTGRMWGHEPCACPRLALCELDIVTADVVSAVECPQVVTDPARTMVDIPTDISNQTTDEAVMRQTWVALVAPTPG